MAAEGLLFRVKMCAQMSPQRAGGLPWNNALLCALRRNLHASVSQNVTTHNFLYRRREPVGVFFIIFIVAEYFRTVRE